MKRILVAVALTAVVVAGLSAVISKVLFDVGTSAKSFGLPQGQPVDNVRFISYSTSPVIVEVVNITTYSATVIDRTVLNAVNTPGNVASVPLYGLSYKNLGVRISSMTSDTIPTNKVGATVYTK